MPLTNLYYMEYGSFGLVANFVLFDLGASIIVPMRLFMCSCFFFFVKINFFIFLNYFVVMILLINFFLKKLLS
jgi:hypothetical protein